jgi:hypothetical protein
MHAAHERGEHTSLKFFSSSNLIYADPEPPSPSFVCRRQSTASLNFLVMTLPLLLLQLLERSAHYERRRASHSNSEPNNIIPMSGCYFSSSSFVVVSF